MIPPSICIISCGKAKYWDAHPDDATNTVKPARDVYTGPLFKKCAELAELTHPYNWYILSDKYGLITPDQLIQNYDVSPEVIKDNNLFRLLVEFQALSLNILKTERVVAPVGKIHESVIKSVFTDSGYINPLAGMSQGKRMQTLTRLIKDKP